jgi:hypothetical protein
MAGKRSRLKPTWNISNRIARVRGVATAGRLARFGCEPLADYLLEKNPSAGTKIKVDVEGEKLKMMEG